MSYKIIIRPIYSFRRQKSRTGKKKETEAEVHKLPRKLRESPHCMSNSWPEPTKQNTCLQHEHQQIEPNCHHAHGASYFTGEKMGLAQHHLLTQIRKLNYHSVRFTQYKEYFYNRCTNAINSYLLQGKSFIIPKLANAKSHHCSGIIM